MRRKEELGVITIYLALTLSIILAFIITTIEVARVETTKTYLARVLQTSMESSLCDYYLPLFEDYHLFGLNLAEGSREEQKARLLETVEHRMNDSLLPTQEDNYLSLVWNGSMASFLLCNPTISTLSIDDCIFLPDDEYVYAKNQMIAYSKYQAPVEIIEKVMTAMGIMEESKEASEVLQDKMELEQKMAKVDEHALRLIELVEGIDTSEYGIEFTTFSKSMTHRSDFAKQIVKSEPTMESVLISNSDIFEVLKEEYYQFSPVIVNLLAKGESVRSQRLEYERHCSEYQELATSLENGTYTKEEKEKLAKELQILAHELIVEYDALNEQVEECAYLSSVIQSAISSTVSEVYIITRAAIYEVNQIRSTQGELKGDYNEYLEKLIQRQEEFSEEFFSMLQEENEFIKKYLDTPDGEISVIVNISQMEQTLNHNLEILTQVQLNQKSDFSITEDGYAMWKAQLTRLEQQLSGLSMEGLQFDYSNLDTKQGGISAFKFITQLFEASLVDMVAGTLEISEEEINQYNLVSSQHTFSENIQSPGEDQMEIEQIMSGGLTLDGWGFDTKGAVGDLAKNLLLTSYVNNHMLNFTSKEKTKDYGLHYEQEYIIAGNYKDQENLSDVVLYLLMFRLLMNCASIMTDSEKGKKAETTAALLVGWIPLAGVTYLIKYLLLIYWAYCEAVIQVSALLHGRSVPVFTGKSDFVVTYSEIYAISDTYVEEKASKYESQNKCTLNYTEYLFLLHLFISERDTVGRALDIIQENIEYEYEDNFLVRNCLISYSCEVESEMEMKFFFLPYFQNNQISLGNQRIQGKASVTY